MRHLPDHIISAFSTTRNDGMLHFSQHLQHDRHTAIYAKHGYPETKKTWKQLFPLIQGTAVHEALHAVMRDSLDYYEEELPVTVDNPLFSYTWTGTADGYMQHEGETWLIDYKTISGPSVDFLDGAKPEHIWQISAYYHFGKPVDRLGILYLPTSGNYKKQWAKPLFFEITPIGKEELLARMVEVEDACKEYAEMGLLPPSPTGSYKWKKRNGKSWYRVYDLMYKPHFTNLFCPWAGLETDLCGCSLEEPRSIAVWDSDDKLTIEEGYDIIVEEAGKPE
jgi:hypothetical protein